MNASLIQTISNLQTPWRESLPNRTVFLQFKFPSFKFPKICSKNNCNKKLHTKNNKLDFLFQDLSHTVTNIENQKKNFKKFTAQHWHFTQRTFQEKMILVKQANIFDKIPNTTSSLPKIFFTQNSLKTSALPQEMVNFMIKATNLQIIRNNASIYTLTKT